MREYRQNPRKYKRIAKQDPQMMKWTRSEIKVNYLDNKFTAERKTLKRFFPFGGRVFFESPTNLSLAIYTWWHGIRHTPLNLPRTETWTDWFNATYYCNRTDRSFKMKHLAWSTKFMFYICDICVNLLKIASNCLRVGTYVTVQRVQLTSLEIQIELNLLFSVFSQLWPAYYVQPKNFRVVVHQPPSLLQIPIIWRHNLRVTHK